MHTIPENSRGDNMRKVAGALLFVAAGAGIALATEKYGGKLIHAVGDACGGKTKCVCDELEDMM